MLPKQKYIQITRCNHSGFTLLELAIVLFIVALLTGGVLVPLGQRMNQQYLQNTQAVLEEAKEGLLGYAVLNGHFPCPANDENGIADASLCSASETQEGFIPWSDLGVGRYDGWGNTLRYRVDKVFTTDETTIVSQNFIGSSNLTIYNVVNNKIAGDNNTIVAVVFSVGKNGIADKTNVVGGTNAHYTQDEQNPEAGFDDRLIWISNNVLASRWVMSGRATVTP
ncbi:prepilin-type N-terminal cleavage/methylation domain-containing protein [Beggiatoa alba B18LD]|uniref:Prepilin-type N-terminal cleavage/methylation domain-containing protein n=1 Tax=Beggiatoa alba B18LD TaxID=395493 RepID=I3CH96_9GAMM|nr:prepilin-type N-terminal cleavage/methylation domain-containing protein [Beggiatoa alba]EIJ42989.1 prepilin-type N-terminal cleavage/methylation domain-containing protein [Beggiatoa alba B18LD]